MDLQHARTLLDRINRVFDDFGQGGTAPSALEQDLLKEYVRRFYESLSDETAGNYRNGGRPERGGGAAADNSAADAAAPRKEPSRRPLSGRQLRSSPVPRPTAPPAKAKAPRAVAAPPPAILQVPDSVEADVRNIEERTPPPQVTASSPPPVAVRAQAPTPTAPPEGTPDPQSLNPQTPEPDLRELFARERGTDLGDRLGNAPIADLTRALALNQRLVFQNELFGKSADSLRDTLAELNKKDDYAGAVAALVTTARRYDWIADERRGPARDFVKLVQRRYPEA